MAKEIQQEAEFFWSQVKGYSYRSKSNIKAKLMTDAGCLQGAIAVSKKSSEQLTEPEIRIMRRALEIVEKL